MRVLEIVRNRQKSLEIVRNRRKENVISLYAQAAEMMMVGALAGASVLWLAYKVTKHLSR